MNASWGAEGGKASGPAVGGRHGRAKLEGSGHKAYDSQGVVAVCMVPKRIVVLALAALVAFVLPVVAQPATPQTAGIQNPNVSTPTTLYFHLDGIQDFPINTQMPDDRYQKGNPYGLATNSFSCAGPLPTGSGGTTDAWHTYYGYATPGYVEYAFEEDGGPRYHKERGISFDALLDTTKPFTIYYYLETQVTSAELPVDPNTAPIPVPNVVVRATMREGDKVSVGDEAFNSGAIIAQGQTDPATLSPQTMSNPQVTHSEVGGKQVYEFAIPMEFALAKIRRDEAYNMRIDVFMDNPVCNDPQYSDGDKYAMANTVRPHTSPGHRPRMDLSVMNPVRIEYLHPQFIGDELVIHTSVNSPWGNYDVDEMDGGIEMSIEGPSPAVSLARAAFVQRHHEHNHHQEAVDITYIWPYKADGAKDGVYTIHFVVRNDQHTSEARGDVQFQIGKGESGSSLPVCEKDVPISEQVNCRVVNTNEASDKKSPGVGLVAVLGLLGAAAVVLRRRR